MMQKQIQESLNWRYAVKKFDPSKKIHESDLNVLMDSLVMTPTSYGLQMTKYLVVQNHEIKSELRKVSWNQSQVTDCSHFVVFAARTNVEEKDIERLVERIKVVRKINDESVMPYKEMMMTNLVATPHQDPVNWNKKQAYIGMGFLLETAALLKVDAVPMEGLDPVAYDKILKLEGTGWTTAMAVALGYRSSEDKYQNLEKVRFPKEEVIEFI